MSEEKENKRLPVDEISSEPFGGMPETAFEMVNRFCRYAERRRRGQTLIERDMDGLPVKRAVKRNGGPWQRELFTDE